MIFNTSIFRLRPKNGACKCIEQRHTGAFNSPRASEKGILDLIDLTMEL